MDELYLCLNTNLTPHDLVRVVWEELFEEWFSPVAAATEKGKILFGDFADDTKLDGRGKLLLPAEVAEGDISKLNPEFVLEEDQEAIMSHLDDLCEELNEHSEKAEISVLGAVPSAFRVKIKEQWRPRFAASFSFQGDCSSLEISLFDAGWILEKEDLLALAQRYETLVAVIGERRSSQIEWHSSGEFELAHDLWRSIFEKLPLENQSYR